MNRTVLLAALGLLVTAAGCTPTSSASYEPEGLVYRLRALKDVYYEYEPLELTLIVTNAGLKAAPMPLTEEGGTVIVRKMTDNDELSWKPRPVTQAVAGEDVMPGEIVDIRLTDRQGQVHMSATGSWAVQYRCQGEGGPKRRIYVSTSDLLLQCAPQPLVIPADTPKPVADALNELMAAPARDFISRRPAWTQVNYSQPMTKLKSLGEAAVPALLANLNHYKIQPAVIQILSDLKCRQAVPRLLNMLQMDDRLSDAQILTALHTITECPKGFDYYTNWLHDAEMQKQAVAWYRNWWMKSK